jgi:hypothetical protein
MGSTPLIIAVLGAFLGSTGTIAIYLGTPLGQEMARPDPFTGSQAARLEARLDEIDRDIHFHLEQHPDATGQFDRRIATLEAQYAIILQNQGRILDRIENNGS